MIISLRDYIALENIPKIKYRMFLVTYNIHNEAPLRIQVIYESIKSKNSQNIYSCSHCSQFINLLVISKTMLFQ